MSRVLAEIPGIGEAACWLDAAPFLPLDDTLVESSETAWRELVAAELDGIAACQVVQCELRSYGIIQGERYVLLATVELDETRVSWRAEYPAGGPYHLSPSVLRYLAGFDAALIATTSALLPELRQASLTAYQQRVQAKLRAIRHSLAAIENALLHAPPRWQAAA